MSLTPRLLISACLCGHICRYDGARLEYPRLAEFAASGLGVPVCPELLGGLPTPRAPCELIRGRAFTADGRDMTGMFMKGAFRVLGIAGEHRIRTAILKERSPSCATSRLYDGTFSGRLTPGMGLTALLLQQKGFTLFNEEDAEHRLTEHLRSS
jgi:uncharacterized protein YbbK (DUF523 family)